MAKKKQKKNAEEPEQGEQIVLATSNMAMFDEACEVLGVDSFQEQFLKTAKELAERAEQQDTGGIDGE